MPVARLRAPREVAVPVVGQPLPRRLGLRHPRRRRRAPGRRGPRPPTPPRSAAPGRPMTAYASASSAATWTTGCRSRPSRSDAGPLGCRHDAPGRPGPPEVDVPQVHRPRRAGEHHRAGLEVLDRRAWEVGRVERSLGHVSIPRGVDEGGVLRVGDLVRGDPEPVDRHRVRGRLLGVVRVRAHREGLGRDPAQVVGSSSRAQPTRSLMAPTGRPASSRSSC